MQSKKVTRKERPKKEYNFRIQNKNKHKSQQTSTLHYHRIFAQKKVPKPSITKKNKYNKNLMFPAVLSQRQY